LQEFCLTATYALKRQPSLPCFLLALLAEPDTAWHGGCLAIAELARRSILSPDLLTQVATPLTAALTYDVRRGPHSVGAHVRDAGAYVCWALARSYDPCQLTDCVHTLAASLLVVTCYDREINCRRAAAAAFQECVGRLGSFPHGLEILSVADYYSVGNMASAYLRVGPFVAQYKEYTQVRSRFSQQGNSRVGSRTTTGVCYRACASTLAWTAPSSRIAVCAFLSSAATALTGASACTPRLRIHGPSPPSQALFDHLLKVKLRHWDKAVRALAAMGLAALAPVAPAQLASKCLPQLLQLVTDDVLEVRCGAVLGIAELLPALAAAGQQQLDGSVSLAVVQVLDRLHAAACYKGKGGELMREMATRLVQQVAAATAGLQVVPLYGGGSSGSSKRHRAEQDMEQQQHSSSSTPSPAGGEDNDGSSSDDDSMDAGTADTTQKQQQQQQTLALPLSCDYHTAAMQLLLDCISHVQEGIQAAGVAALRAYACAHQQQQHEQLLQLVVRCCHRLTEREAAAAVRRGAAAALGAMPHGLLHEKAELVLSILVATVQVGWSGDGAYSRGLFNWLMLLREYPAR